jgi:hypothetical protein
MLRRVLLIVLAGAAIVAAAEQGWMDLFDGKTLDGWEVEGKGSWSVLEPEVLLGQCDPADPCLPQSWLYTKREFRQYDLSLDYWLRLGGNSGVSIGDRTRARDAVDLKTHGWPTPARFAYEVNIDNAVPNGYDITGSIYTLVAAEAGPQRRLGWNALLIEVRDNSIRVTLNGRLVAQHPGVADRSKAGPIGLQLHSPSDVVMFRNIRIREVR